MALWFVSYATSPITVTIYDVSIVIFYDVTLLLSMTYHFESRLGKTDCTDIWVIKLKKPSIAIYRISGPPSVHYAHTTDLTTELWEIPIFSPADGALILYMIKKH